MSGTRGKLKVYLLIAIAVVVSCVYGAVNVTNLLNEKYDKKNLELITQQTAENEGFCLTEFIEEYSLSFNSIAQLYKDACVSIKVVSQGSSWLGSGVCVASKGFVTNDGEELESGSYIITNHHVIQNYFDYEITEVYVYPNEYNSLERYGGYEIVYDAEVLWADSYLDVGIIYTKQNIDWVYMKDRFISPNQDDVVAYTERGFVIGTPQSLSYQNTITKGYFYSDLSYSYTVNTALFEDVMSNIYEDLIPMKISIMGGNSGGGLFDSDGYLIGIPTLGSSRSQASDAINYAVPIYSIKLILDYVIIQHENEKEIEICSIDDLNFSTIDSKESDIMNSQFKSRSLYFYGRTYLKKDLSNFNENGLKVIYSDEELIEKEDVILSVIMDEKTTIIEDRNDLIYFLLQTKKGSTVGFEIKDSDIIEIVI